MQAVEIPLGTSTEHQRDVAQRTAKQTAVETADQVMDLDKLTFYLKSLKMGKLPKNEQLKSMLQQLRTNPGIDRRASEMSKDGQNLLADFRQLVKVLEQCLDTKNSSELTQSLIYHLRNADAESIKNQSAGMAPGTSMDKSQLKQTASTGFNNLKLVAKLIFVNDEFQNLVTELLDIVKDIFGGAQQRIRENVKGTTEQTKQDKPMSEEWNERQKRLKEAAGGEEIKRTGEVQTEQLKSEADQQWEDVKRKASESWGNLRQTTSQTGKQELQTTKADLQQSFSEEKQRDLIRRLKAVMVQVQRHAEYQQAMDSMQEAFSRWFNEASDMQGQVSQVAGKTATQLKADSNISKAALEAKTIAEDWAQGQSLDPLVHKVKQLFSDIKNDERLRTYINQAWQYIQRLVRDPDYVEDEQSTKDGEGLIQRGRSDEFDNYRATLSDGFDYAKSFCQAMAKDSTAIEIRNVLKSIHRDLWLDEAGNTTFKPHLLKDIGITLLPAIMDKINSLPIPHIEYHDDKFDVAVENMVLTGSSILPQDIDIKMYNHMQYSASTTANNQQTLYMHFSRVQVQMQDVIFYYKKMGFPSISDRGVANINTYGKGISLTLGLTSDSRNNVNTYTVQTCNCNVDKLHFRIHDSRHNLLYRTAHPMVTTIVKHQLGRIIAAKIKEGLVSGDQWLSQQLKQHATPIEITPPSATVAPVTTPRVKRPGLFSAIITIINNRMKTKRHQKQVERHEKEKAKIHQREAEAANMDAPPGQSFVKDDEHDPANPVTMHENTQYENAAWMDETRQPAPATVNKEPQQEMSKSSTVDGGVQQSAPIKTDTLNRPSKTDDSAAAAATGPMAMDDSPQQSNMLGATMDDNLRQGDPTSMKTNRFQEVNPTTMHDDLGDTLDGRLQSGNVTDMNRNLYQVNPTSNSNALQPSL